MFGGLSIGRSLLSLVVQAGGMVLLFCAHAYGSRVTTPSSYGAFVVALGILNILSAAGRAGADQLGMRVLAGLSENEKQNRNNTVRWCFRRSVVASLSISVVLLIISRYFSNGDWTDQMYFVAALLPILSVVFVLEGVNRTFFSAAVAQMPQRVLLPLALLVTIYIWSESHWSEGLMLGYTYGGAVLFAAICAAVLTLSGLRSSSDDSPKIVAVQSFEGWSETANRLCITATLSLVVAHVDTVIIGFIMGDAAAGRYAVAYRIGAVLALAQTSVNAVFAPRFAKHWRGQNLPAMRHAVSASSISASVASLAGLLFLFLFHRFFFDMFGQSVNSEQLLITALVAVTYTIAACAGPVGPLLNMTGNEKHVLRAYIAAASVNVFLCVVLIYSVGVVGAAVATFFTVVGWNLVLNRAVRKELRISPDVLSGLARVREEAR